jgi:hypothetical protein
MRFEEGMKLGGAGDHEAARLKFSQAWTLVQSPNIVYNLALAELKSNHPVEALTHFRTFTKMSDNPKVTDQMRDRAAQHIQELKLVVCQIEVVAPARARVAVDKHAVDVDAGDLVAASPGKHVVDVVPMEGPAKSETVECVAGVTVKADFMVVTLVQKKRDEPQPSPATVVEPPPSARPSPRFWTTGRIVGAIAAGAGIAALAGGLIYHLNADAAKSEADAARGYLPPPKRSACTDRPDLYACTVLQGQGEAYETNQALRSAALISGSALLVGGTVLFLLSSPSAPKENLAHASPRVLPLATEREAGLMVTGRF